VLICCERKVLLAVCWFVLREKYRWLVADKPNEPDANQPANPATNPAPVNHSARPTR
jgi:hypothetical protein